MNRDSLYKELDDVQRDMRGISPRLSLYAKLKAKETELLAKVGGLEGGKHDLAPNNEQFNYDPRKKCRVMGCAQLGAPVGNSKKIVDKRTGNRKRHDLCTQHQQMMKKGQLKISEIGI